MDYTYCPKCATELTLFMDMDQRRMRCSSCGWIHYKNPTVGVAIATLEDGELLLGERRDGGWCIPCGHVEWGERVAAAAVREFREETGLKVEIIELLAVHSNFHDSEHYTVGIWYRGEIIGGNLRAGGDLVQVGYFPLKKLPDLKFPNDQKIIQQLVSANN